MTPFMVKDKWSGEERLVLAILADGGLLTLGSDMDLTIIEDDLEDWHVRTLNMAFANDQTNTWFVAKWGGR